MSDIAILGTGLIGAAMVHNLLDKGRSVRVWNRTAAKAEGVAAAGAVLSASPADAVRGVRHVHLALSADDAVDEVVAALRPGLGEGVPVLDHSTNLPARVATRYAALREDGVAYVPAPVFMSPQNAREGSGLMVLSAPDDEVAALVAHLESMTGKVLHAGARPDTAAVFKLAGNSLYFALTAAMRDVLSIGQGAGVEPAKLLELFATWKVGGALPWLGKMLASSERGPASFELAMARKDARLMEETAAGQHTLLLPAIVAAMDAALANGQAAADYSVFCDP